MKIFSILLIALALTSCAGTTPPANEVIVYKYKDVMIPVPCDTDVKCDFSGEGYVPTKKLLQCVIEQKHALDYCKQSGSTKDANN